MIPWHKITVTLNKCFPRTFLNSMRLNVYNNCTESAQLLFPQAQKFFVYH